MEYIVVQADMGMGYDTDVFESKVNSKIAEGFTPLGGVAVFGGSIKVIAQAMVREDCSREFSPPIL